MARPTLDTIAAAIATWDISVDSNFSKITEAPFPIYQVATTGELPAAASYDYCIAVVGTGAAAQIYISTGSAWVLHAPAEAAYVAASTATTIAGLVTDYNELRTSLINAGIMAAS